MNVRQMPLDELELLSYADIAYELLKLDKKPKTTPVLFGEVCGLLDINEDNMMDMIGDFYTSLTTDKRFVFLDTNEWDLREKNPVDIVMDEDEDEEEIEDEEMNEEDQEETSEYEDDIDTMMEDEDIVDDEELDDLSILSDEELEEH